MTAAPRLDRDGRDGEPSYPRLDRDTLADDLRERVFPRAAAPDTAPQIGAEVEIIPVDVASGRPLALDGRGLTTLSILRRAGDGVGWRERRSAKANVPEIELGDGGRITFEPGGQIEISSAPSASVRSCVSGGASTLGRSGRSGSVAS